MPPHQASPAKGGFSQRRGFVGAVARFWCRSYAPDYVGLFVLVVGWFSVGNIPFSNRNSTICPSPSLLNDAFVPIMLTGGVPQIQLFVHPFYQMFTLDNIDIQYPFAEVERVPLRE